MATLMWPFGIVRKRRYCRRYKAALVVLLGAYMFDSLDAGQKARVETALEDNFKRSLEPGAAWRRWARWYVLAAFRAAAMERIGLDPVVPGVSWSQLFQPWNFLRRLPQWPLLPGGFDNRPAVLIFDYMPFDQATADAKAFLRRNGMSIPEIDPWETGSNDDLDGTGAFINIAGSSQQWQKGR